jgi:hypothetical protein
MKYNLAGPIHAFAFTNATLNGKNPYVKALQQLKMLGPEKDKPKYEKAIGFANEHWCPHGAYKNTAQPCKPTPRMMAPN